MDKETGEEKVEYIINYLKVIHFYKDVYPKCLEKLRKEKEES